MPDTHAFWEEATRGGHTNMKRTWFQSTLEGFEPKTLQHIMQRYHSNYNLNQILTGTIV